MRLQLILVGSVAAIALAACGGKKETTIAPGVKIEQTNGGETTTMKATGENGEQSTFTFGSGAKLPDNLPAFVKVYPGVEVLSVMGGNSSDGVGGMITAHSKDSPDKVAAFYREHMKSLKFSTNSEQSTGDGLVLTGGEDGRSLVVSVTKADGGAEIMLQYGAKAAK